MKVFLYILACLFFVGIWFALSTFIAPYFIWLTNGDLLYILMFGAILGLLFIFLPLMISTDMEEYRKKNRYIITLIAVPVTLWMGSLATYLRGTNYVHCYKDYYAYRGNLYTKYGKKLADYDWESEFENNRFYMFNSEKNNIGSIYDLNEGRIVLENTNLKYGGKKIEENDCYGIVSKSTGTVVLPAIYDEIRYTDNGWIVAKKSGKYGVLSPLGINLVDFDFKKYVYTDNYTKEYDFVCLQDADNSYNLFKMSWRYGDCVIKTKYKVESVYKEDRFMVIDTDESYMLIDDDGTILLGSCSYMSYDKETDIIKYKKNYAYDYEKIAMP